MYASKIGNDGTPLAIGEEALLEDYYLNFREENFLITLTGFDSEKETIDGLITIAKAVDERIQNKRIVKEDVKEIIDGGLIVIRKAVEQAILSVESSIRQGLTALPFALVCLYLVCQ